MLLTVDDLVRHISTEETDDVLESKLKALELLIRRYTNNNFKVKGTARIADVVGGLFMVEEPHSFEVGDTVQVSGSERNDGLYTVTDVTDTTFRVKEKTRDEIDILATLVEYPEDVKMGAVGMMKWDLENREKVGVQSETISRHTVTYTALNAENSVLGYPDALTNFLKLHKKARFGQRGQL